VIDGDNSLQIVFNESQFAIRSPSLYLVSARLSGSISPTCCSILYSTYQTFSETHSCGELYLHLYFGLKMTFITTSWYHDTLTLGRTISVLCALCERSRKLSRWNRT